MDEERNSEVRDVNILAQEIGMSFINFEAVFNFYKHNAQELGFGVVKRTTKMTDGKATYVMIACSRHGKMHRTVTNLRPRPSVVKTNCLTRINVVINVDSSCVISKIVLEHNHILSPYKSRFFSCNRVIDPSIKRRLDLNDRTGIRLNKNFNSIAVEAGGYENLTFGENDARNYIEKVRRLRLGEGDGEAICNYFREMQERNGNFFYSIDLDDDSRLRNVFWADARSRTAYECFGDVITFDSTYLTNKYDMPFAPFVGVNHHGQSILLGCGLLSTKDTESFVWLFRNWLSCMSERAPKAIITDQDKAMQNAIARVFPNTRHRWCLWHITKKIPEKLRSYGEYHSMKSVMMDAIYESLTEIEFEEKWKRMIACYALENNQWLSGLYEERHKWIPAYVKDTFWAGMSTTQRSESMNAFFDGYVNSKTSLKQFVEQYESAIKNKAEKEAELDYKSFSSVIPCISRYAFEKQFQDVYTITKFREFQAELKELLHCETSLLSSTGSVYSYQVNEYGDGGKDVPFTVYFDEGTSLVSCICRLFEYKGILCRHSIAVLVHRKLMIVPNSYILTRWRKDVRRRYTRVKTWHKNLGSTAEIYRYEVVCSNMYDIADIAAESDEKCEVALRTLRDLKTKLEYTSSSKGSNDIEYSPIAATPSNGASDDRSNDRRVLSPLPVRSKGRPPSKRKESMTDKVVRRLKMKGNKQ
ncbi:protein FAR-RED IMPAIRED RESPONSE 1-like [Ananas comosus]|uniref:Protein FAR1-RELATED SEQUENCE n=1 Tax=Ananas comosus TaxID=4615 RepID=A0A6P5EFT9_ANACO|nr:protein FAR-RED IMPAIRED RESPONSE 1-like [Ananas comosus]